MEFKAKDIEGFLIRKRTSNGPMGDDERDKLVYNSAISEQGEKVLVIELCKECSKGQIAVMVGGSGTIGHTSTIYEDCPDCKGNGFTVRGGNDQHESERKVAEWF